MSGTFPADDLFDLPLLDERDWLHSKKIRPSLRGLFLAIFASLFIHLLFFQWKISAQNARLTVLLTKPIHISLNYIVQPTLPTVTKVIPNQADIVIPLASEQQPLLQVNNSSMASDVMSTEQAGRISDKQQQVIIEPKIRQQHRYHETYPTSINAEASLSYSTELASQQNDSGKSPQHFNDVFDPRLRARLQNNFANKTTEQVSGLTDLTDVHGNTIVELDNGSCLRSVPTAMGQPTNWYMTTCSGTTSESEQMMERINNEVRRRR